MSQLTHLSFPPRRGRIVESSFNSILQGLLALQSDVFTCVPTEDCYKVRNFVQLSVVAGLYRSFGEVSPRNTATDYISRKFRPRGFVRVFTVPPFVICLSFFLVFGLSLEVGQNATSFSMDFDLDFKTCQLFSFEWLIYSSLVCKGE